MQLIKNNNFKRIAIGMSGGVDSTVSALLLKKKGFDVIGIYMKNWDLLDEKINECSANNDVEDAEWVCKRLGIQFRVVDFVKDYWNGVFMKFLDEYQKGYTPNPDILCNKNVKFKKFYEHAVNRLGCDAISMGHYANTSFGNYLELYNEDERNHLLKAKDCVKDQTFFLCQIPQEALRKTMFPVGNILKNEVKKIAEENFFDRILKKRESVGMCYIGKRDFPDFMGEYVPAKSGTFVDVDSGQVIGSHNGIHNYTIGQRCRLDGKSVRKYIVKKDVQTQEIFIVNGSQHPALYSVGLHTSAPHWICKVPDVLAQRGMAGVFRCDFRFQHTHPLRKCTVVYDANNGLIVKFDSPLKSVSPGQYIVLYDGNECLGGAQIRFAGPTLYSLQKIQNNKESEDLLENEKCMSRSI